MPLLKFLQGSRRLLGLFVFVCVVWLYGQMFLVVRGAPHQSDGATLNSVSRGGGHLAVFLSAVIHSVMMTQTEKN